MFQRLISTQLSAVCRKTVGCFNTIVPRNTTRPLVTNDGVFGLQRYHGWESGILIRTALHSRLRHFNISKRYSAPPPPFQPLPACDSPLLFTVAELHRTLQEQGVEVCRDIQGRRVSAELCYFVTHAQRRVPLSFVVVLNVFIFFCRPLYSFITSSVQDRFVYGTQRRRTIVRMRRANCPPSIGEQYIHRGIKSFQRYE